MNAGTLRLFVFAFMVTPHGKAQTPAVPSEQKPQPTSNCPIKMEKVSLFPGVRDDLVMFLHFKNETQKEIVGENFSLTFFDAVQEPHPALEDYDSHAKAKPGESKRASWTIGLDRGNPGWRGKQFDVTVKELLFSDGSKWKSNGESACVLKHTAR